MNQWTEDGKQCLDDVQVWSLPLGEQTIIFQAKVFAILQVVTMEEIKNDSKKKIRICLDSQAALKVLLRPRASSALF